MGAWYFDSGRMNDNARMKLFTFAIATMAIGSLALVKAGTSAAITYIPGDQVRKAFEKGAVLLNNGTYQVHAGRRDEAGQAEVHVRDTDIIYVLEGTTTFVTGGTVVGGKTSAPDEIRGTGVSGGETRTLNKGDVIVVPNGTPHWFKTVPGPVLYYVVKVR
jgi:mannose-6-phosphate isomerase-like protein (cupin superfamily)